MGLPLWTTPCTARSLSLAGGGGGAGIRVVTGLFIPRTCGERRAPFRSLCNFQTASPVLPISFPVCFNISGIPPFGLTPAGPSCRVDRGVRPMTVPFKEGTSGRFSTRTCGGMLLWDRMGIELPSQSKWAKRGGGGARPVGGPTGFRFIGVRGFNQRTISLWRLWDEDHAGVWGWATQEAAVDWCSVRVTVAVCQ